MHELSLVGAVVESLEEMAMEKGWKKVTKVTLRIGRMRQVIPEVMIFSFSVVTEGTIMEGSSLEILEVPLMSRCSFCGEEWEGLSFQCPRCGSDQVETVSGMEMDLESVEVEE
ncbi:MAG: hydrogenase nickel incorporation protein [Synergistetes bacterium ADurb.Bin155]|nr:hydrogenase maturation nickel metallochaperone HypA [Synergistales bacterium]NMD17134.1 hydrogenase maturation nickel metallochaperone HypA [Synergistaceae bacterium]OQB47031.1 MAG: hydrogenase nickel incorporation protein [Synergistetes bacterium ADurb.Bin155]MBP8995446.1 hydrogenase maturation nickel metallochaperone HypA [Synergistales bacterium]HOC81774.1 hydrogenase maturation nickel metallochaperone HypA [Synergistales bacterium]